MKKIVLIILSFVVFSCSSKQTTDTGENQVLAIEEETSELVEKEAQAINIVAEAEANKANNDVPANQSEVSKVLQFTAKEKIAVQEVKVKFEAGIMKGTPFTKLNEAYTAHADLIRRDQFNKVPVTMTFPFNGGFDLSMIGEKVNDLSFFTKKCGFQKENGEVLNFHCLLNESNLMEMMAEEGKSNSLINSIYEDYQKSKSITNGIQQSLIMSSAEEFDFSKENHQLIYLFYQIAINEERLATEKLQ